MAEGTSRKHHNSSQTVELDLAFIGWCQFALKRKLWGDTGKHSKKVLLERKITLYRVYEEKTYEYEENHHCNT